MFRLVYTRLVEIVVCIQTLDIESCHLKQPITGWYCLISTSKLVQLVYLSVLSKQKSLSYPTNKC